MKILHRAGRALHRLGRLVRDSAACLSRCCGCSFYRRAESCIGVAYNPPASPLCPALPDVYVCNNVASQGQVFAYNGSCYIVGAGAENIPDGAVRIDDAAMIEFVPDCYDGRCNSNRFFYKATRCAGEPLTAPDFYVCVAGVYWDCKVFKFNPGDGTPNQYCYRLDRSTPIDEDDIPNGAIRIAEVAVPESSQFERCCDCLDGCDRDTIISAPCAQPPTTTPCCCNRATPKRFTYTLSYVERESRAGFSNLFAVTTFETVVAPSILCNGDGTFVETVGSQRITTVLFDGTVSTTTGEIRVPEDVCGLCHTPPFINFAAPCSGSDIRTDQFGAPYRYTWQWTVGNACRRSFAFTYDKEENFSDPTTYRELDRREEYVMEDLGSNERCTGGCDGYTGIPAPALTASQRAAIARGE